MKGYSFIYCVYLFFCLIFTKCFFRPAKLVRLPIRTRNIKNLSFGRFFTSGIHCRLECVPDDNGLIGKITFGDDVSINDRVHIASASSVDIGSGCLIASNVYISDHDHTIPETIHDLPASTGLSVKEVVIGRNCWIGQNVNILKGVSLGDGCIVGSGAVVTSSFPDRTVIAGVPARAIRSLK